MTCAFCLKESGNDFVSLDREFEITPSSNYLQELFCAAKLENIGMKWEIQSSDSTSSNKTVL